MAPVGQQNSARALSHRSCSTELTLVLRVPFAVIVADCAGLLAVHDADGTVAEGCAFPVAPCRGVEATRAGSTTAGRSAERRR